LKKELTKLIRPLFVELPRFKIEYGVKPLKQTLKAMNVIAPFESGGHFNRMTEDEVRQKVSEEEEEHEGEGEGKDEEDEDEDEEVMDRN